MSRRVVVSGMGAIASIGCGVEDFWRALTAGTCGIKALTLFDPSGYRTQTAAQIDHVDESFLSHRDRQRMSRADKLALGATREALENAGLGDASEAQLQRTGVVLGGGVSGLMDSEEFYRDLLHGEARKTRPRQILNFFPDATTDHLARWFGFRGPRSTVVTACSSAAIAMGYAADLIRAGRADRVITGGSDVLARLTYGGFNSLRAVDPEPCKPFDRTRKGMSVGEAAGILVFEELEHARRRGVVPRVEFLGYGVTSDAHHMTAPEPSGAAGARTITAALASARIGASDVDYVNAHGTATLQNDSAECAAIQRALGDRAGAIPVSSIKSMLGHCLCASGAIEAVATVLTIERGVVPPTINYREPDPDCDLDVVPNTAREIPVATAISNSFAFGGNSACVVFSSARLSSLSA